MKRLVLIIAVVIIAGMAVAQVPVGRTVVMLGSQAVKGVRNYNKSLQEIQAQQEATLPRVPLMPQTTPMSLPNPKKNVSYLPPKRVDPTLTLYRTSVLNLPKSLMGQQNQARSLGSHSLNKDTQQMLDRFLSYVRIESQSVEVPELDSFPMTEGQIQIAKFIYNEIKSFGGEVEISLSPDYYVYAKITSNIKKKVPSIMFMAHMDVTPEANGKGINPQVHPNYDGKDIALGNGLILSPNEPNGRHLKDLVGKTIITSDGNTLLGADCKTGCAILVTLIEQMVNDKNFKHGDVYFCFGQNEDVGKVQDRMDADILSNVDMLIDVDGNDYGKYSIANFTAVNRSYYFSGNQAHSSHGKELSYADARTAMAYFIGQLPPEIHPSNSEGRQGYVHCYGMEQTNNGADERVLFRIRYFEKSDFQYYDKCLAEAMKKTQEAYPLVDITLENDFTQYENVAYNMHPKTIEVIQNAVAKSNVKMEPFELRAGTTCALMVAKGLPGGPCLYSGQQAVHSVYEWCCIEEMIELVELTKNIVAEAREIK